MPITLVVVELSKECSLFVDLWHIPRWIQTHTNTNIILLNFGDCTKIFKLDTMFEPRWYNLHVL